jgi:hypothetical protein
MRIWIILNPLRAEFEKLEDKLLVLKGKLARPFLTSMQVTTC